MIFPFPAYTLLNYSHPPSLYREEGGCYIKEGLWQGADGHANLSNTSSEVTALEWIVNELLSEVFQVAIV